MTAAFCDVNKDADNRKDASGASTRIFSNLSSTISQLAARVSGADAAVGGGDPDVSMEEDEEDEEEEEDQPVAVAAKEEKSRNSVGEKNGGTNHDPTEEVMETNETAALNGGTTFQTSSTSSSSSTSLSKDCATMVNGDAGDDVLDGTADIASTSQTTPRPDGAGSSSPKPLSAPVVPVSLMAASTSAHAGSSRAFLTKEQINAIIEHKFQAYVKNLCKTEELETRFKNLEECTENLKLWNRCLVLLVGSI